MWRRTKKQREHFRRTWHFYRRPHVMFVLILSFVSAAIIAAYMGTGYLYITTHPYTDDPNFYVQTLVTIFFTRNDAEEMIPIIKCESRFRHYNLDGSVLQNMEGSSAMGVAQILTSAHPDPKIIYRYNKRYGTDIEARDLDVTKLSDNLRYALILYKVNGTRDWACSKLI